MAASITIIASLAGEDGKPTQKSTKLNVLQTTTVKALEELVIEKLGAAAPVRIWHAEKSNASYKKLNDRVPKTSPLGNFFISVWLHVSSILKNILMTKS
jgi:hypothetical protein